MTKRKRTKALDSPKDIASGDALFNDIVAIIDQQRALRAKTVPEPIRSGGQLAVKHQRTVRITDSTSGDQIAIIPKHWIPLIVRLETGSFTHEELVALQKTIPDEEYSVEKSSQEIVDWARGLK